MDPIHRVSELCPDAFLGFLDSHTLGGTAPLAEVTACGLIRAGVVVLTYGRGVGYPGVDPRPRAENSLSE